MPAVDKCEESIIRALEKEGWTLVRRPEGIRLEARRFLYVDLKLKNADNIQIVLIEVKCFPANSIETDELYRAIGQYILYRSILQIEKRSEPLFLAIPKTIYDSLFQLKAVQHAIKSAKIKMVVVDLEREEVTLWKT
jgi:hypothetical protein